MLGLTDSTPSHYTDAKFEMTKRDQISWEARYDDVMPLANDANSCECTTALSSLRLSSQRRPEGCCTQLILG